MTGKGEPRANDHAHVGPPVEHVDHPQHFIEGNSEIGIDEPRGISPRRKCVHHPLPHRFRLAAVPG